MEAACLAWGPLSPLGSWAKLMRETTHVWWMGIHQWSSYQFWHVKLYILLLVSSLQLYLLSSIDLHVVNLSTYLHLWIESHSVMWMHDSITDSYAAFFEGGIMGRVCKKKLRYNSILYKAREPPVNLWCNFVCIVISTRVFITDNRLWAFLFKVAMPNWWRIKGEFNRTEPSSFLYLQFCIDLC